VIAAIRLNKPMFSAEKQAREDKIWRTTDEAVRSHQIMQLTDLRITEIHNRQYNDYAKLACIVGAFILVIMTIRHLFL
jgi:hypothetical protein